MIPSLVGTHDTATADYFEDTRVCVKRCARGYADSGLSGNSLLPYYRVSGFLVTHVFEFGLMTNVNGFRRIFLLDLSASFLGRGDCQTAEAQTLSSVRDV